MTEEEARNKVIYDVPRETTKRLDAFASLLHEQARYQNLISRTTTTAIWSRHFLDSAQLVKLVPCSGAWIDIGSGAGLPGLVVAALTGRPVMLIEPRAKRCDFLRQAVALMGLEDSVSVVQAKAQNAPLNVASVISARAVAPLVDLFRMGLRFAAKDTVWLLPKGRSVQEEVAVAGASWHACIELVPSITDPEAAIVVASEVTLRKRK